MAWKERLTGDIRVYHTMREKKQKVHSVGLGRTERVLYVVCVHLCGVVHVALQKRKILVLY